jgi:hypothetical protein
VSSLAGDCLASDTWAQLLAIHCPLAVYGHHWLQCMYVRKYVCVCVCVYVCMYVLYNIRGYLISYVHQFYRVTPLKTPVGLLIPLLQSQSHVTTITPIIHYAVSYLHSLQSYTFVTTITYYTLTRLHWLTSQISITISNYHRFNIFTLRLSPRTDSANSLLKTPLENWLLNNSLVELLLKNCLENC